VIISFFLLCKYITHSFLERTQFSKEGNNIEILNSDIFEKEKAMITKALEQEKKGNTFEHNDVWNELLK